MPENPTLIRVFRIPPPTPEYCFGKGKPMTFQEVDWFHDSVANPGLWRDEAQMMAHSITTPEGRAALGEHLKEKVYYTPGDALLVLNAQHSFTIGYTAAR